VVHLFTTPEAAQVLQSQPDPRLRIHDARTSKSSAENYASSSKSSSPWLDWMEDALQGRALDAVHFVCDTEAAEERPTLLLRASPRPERYPSLSAIYASEVASFLQRTGAWAALFSPPPTSGTEGCCRYFADSLAQIRPGPVLFHEFSDDHLARGQLDNVYRFLFASEPTEAPRLQRDFLYCQPALVRDYDNWDAERPPELGPPRASYLKRTLASVSQRTDLIPDINLPEAPAWTSAAQRFVERASLDSARFRQSAKDSFLVDSVRSSALSANTVVQDTLIQIQKIIDQHATPQQEDN
jgi:hypothetical protein